MRSSRFFFFVLILYRLSHGPQFFRGLKQDGLFQAALAAVFAFVALGVVYVVARVSGYEAGTAAGLFAGALTKVGNNRNGWRCHQ